MSESMDLVVAKNTTTTATYYDNYYYYCSYYYQCTSVSHPSCGMYGGTSSPVARDVRGCRVSRST